MGKRILLVDDDEKLRRLIKEYLEGYEFQVFTLADGEAVMNSIRKELPELVILDVMLPKKDGLEVLKEIRVASHVPVIMLTAKGEEADRVVGLELGADDYLPKPFSPRELLARIRAVVRRARGQAGPRLEAVRVGKLALDPAARRATLGGKDVPLTGYEFSLLYALASRAGRILTREQLIELAGGNPEEAFDRSVDVHVSRLRQKLGDDSRSPRMLKTVRGAGYMLAAEPE